MNITELFPDAHEISFEAIREGDIIARLASGNVIVSEAVKQTGFHGPAKWLSENQETFAAIKGRDHYLVRRPAQKLPTEQGDMVRVLKPRRSAFTNPGDVFVLNDGRFHCCATTNNLEPQEFERYGITWERVYYTNLGPDCEGIVDAEVLEDDGDGIPHNLIELTSGMYNGALLRYHAPSNHFRGMDPEGNPLSLTHATVVASDWIAAAIIRGI